MSVVSSIAGAAGGILGSGGDIAGTLISGALAPNTPKESDIFSAAGQSLYGGLSIDAQNQLNQLQSVQNPTPQQQQQIQQLQQTASNRTGYLGQILAANQTFQPQANQIALQSQMQGASGLAQNQQQLQSQYGGQLGQTLLAQNQALNPQYFSAQNQLGNTLNTQLASGGLTPQQVQFYQNQFQAGQAAQGLGDSPLGAQNAALQLTGLNLQQNQQNIANSQGYLNTFGFQQTPQISGAGVNTSNILGGSLTAPSLSDANNLASNLAGLQYQQQLGFANQLGSGLGGLASAGYSNGTNTSSMGGGGMSGGAGLFSQL